MRSKSTGIPINPSGLCQCGCGESAPIAKRTNSCFGHIEGLPVRYVRGHQRRGDGFSEQGDNPGGLCQCGCGRKTSLVHGRPRRFIFGHQTRLSGVDWIEEDRGYKTPCHIWQRALMKTGGYGSDAGHRAHVVAWESVNGPVPNGKVLDHLCRVTACRNPDHLEPVTQQVNIQRGGRAVLDPEKVRAIRAMSATHTIADIARFFSISFTTASCVVHGKTWRNID